MASPDRSVTKQVRFRAGGVLRPGDLYVRRVIDDIALQLLSSGEIVLALGSRQTGKSSLLRQLQRQLSPTHQVAFISLDTLTTTDDASQFAESLVDALLTALSVPDAEREATVTTLRPLAPGLRIERVFDVVAARGTKPIVMMFDEVDSTQRLPKAVASDFWVSCRSVWQKHDQRVTFAFFGVMDPDLTAHDRERTPFNVGERLSLDELPREHFDLEQLRALSDDPAQFLDEVLHWTGGHPYLTQRIFVAREQTKSAPVSKLVEDLFFRDGLTSDSCLRSVDNQFRGSTVARAEEDVLHLAASRDDDREIGEMLALYQRVRRKELVHELPADRVKRRLALAGLTTARQPTSNAPRVLAPRNLVFERVFDEAWIKQKLDALSRPLLDQTLRWIASGRDDSDLLRGAALDLAEKHIASTTDVTDDERQFVAASRRAADLAAARQRRNALLAGSAIVLLSLVGTGASAWFATKATNANKEAQRQRAEAETRRAQAVTAERAAQTAAEEARRQERIANDARDRARSAEADAREAETRATTAAVEAQRLSTLRAVALTEQRRATARAQSAEQSARNEAFRADYSSREAQRQATRAEAQVLARLADDNTYRSLPDDRLWRSQIALRSYQSLEIEGFSVESRGAVLEALSRCVRWALDSPVEEKNGIFSRINRDTDAVMLSPTGEQIAILRQYPSSTGELPQQLLRWTNIWNTPQSQQFTRENPSSAVWSLSSDTLYVTTSAGTAYQWSAQQLGRFVETCPRLYTSSDHVLCVDRPYNRARWCSATGTCSTVNTAASVQWSEFSDVAPRFDGALFWLVGAGRSQLLVNSRGRNSWPSAPLNVGTFSAELAATRTVIPVRTTTPSTSAWLALNSSGDVVRWLTETNALGDSRWRARALQLPGTLSLSVVRVVPAPDGYSALALTRQGTVARLDFDATNLDDTSVRLLPGDNYVEIGWRGRDPVAATADGTLVRWERGERWIFDSESRPIRWASWSSTPTRLATIDSANVLTIRDGDSAARIATFIVETSTTGAWSSAGSLAWISSGNLHLWTPSNHRVLSFVGQGPQTLRWLNTTRIQLASDDGTFREVDTITGSVTVAPSAPCATSGRVLDESIAERLFVCSEPRTTDAAAPNPRLYLAQRGLGEVPSARISAATITADRAVWIAPSGEHRILRYSNGTALSPQSFTVPGLKPVEQLSAQGTTLAALVRSEDNVRVVTAMLGDSLQWTEQSIGDERNNRGSTLAFRWIANGRLLLASQQRIDVIVPSHHEQSVAFEPSSGVYRFVAATPNGDRLLVVDSRGRASIIALDAALLRSVFRFGHSPIISKSVNKSSDEVNTCRI